MASITLLVNGVEHLLDVAADTPLLWLLRDTLGLTGTKYGCGIGECGACTVHVDGEPVRSCEVRASDVIGKLITTIEGLSSQGDHPLQQAWIAENVPQCGYCQPGQIMAAAALLARVPNPTDDEIDLAMLGQLCRCGTYQRIRRAIHAAAESVASQELGESTTAIAFPSEHTRVRSATGLLPLAGAVALAGIGSKANISRRDFLKVSAAAGTALVISITLPGCKTPPSPTPVSSTAVPATPVSTGVAESASAPTLTPTTGPTMLPTSEPVPVEPTSPGAPAPTATPTAAPLTPTETPAPTFTPTPTASFEPSVFLRIDNNDVVTITIHRSEMGQGVRTSLAMILAEELEADWSKIRVEQAPADPRYGSQDTHGSLSIIECFDPLRRAGAAARMMLVAAAAQTWGVEQESCRAEKGSILHIPTDRRLAYGDLAETAATLPLPSSSEIALKEPADFKIIGNSIGGVDNHRFIDGSAVFGIDVRLPDMLYATVARCPVFGGNVASFDEGPARSVEGVRHVIQIDSGIAVVADSTWAAIQGREALEVNWSEGSGARLSSETLRHWFAEEAALATSNSDGLMLEAVYGMPFLAHTTMSPMNCVAHVGDDFCEIWAPTQRPATAKSRARSYVSMPESAITVHVSLLGGGFGRRREADYVAEAVQISKAVGAPIKLIWTRDDDIQHDFYHPLSYQHIGTRVDTPGRYRTLASQTLAGVPTAAWRSATNLTPAFVRECLIDELAAASGSDPYELRLKLPEYAQLSQVLEVAATQAGWGTSLPDNWGRGIAAHSTWGASHVAEVVEVSVSQTGAIRVHRVVCAIDCGMVINPDTVAAQMEGGIVYGLTAALKGEITVENGRVQQSNFHDYPMLRIDEMPLVEVFILSSSRTPQGAGEMSVPPVIPALANAVYDATGKRIRRLPIQPEDLRDA